MNGEPSVPPAALARAPLRSMTGYASVREETSAGELTVSLRSVNHRGLDLHFYHNPELGAFENEMRSLLKQQIARAHVEVRLHLARSKGEEAGGYNREILNRYIGAFRQASKEFKLDSKPDLNALLTLPGVFTEKQSSEALPETFGAELLGTLRQCVKDLNASREREGAALGEELRTQSAEIESRTQEILAIRTEALPHFEQRLRSKLAELLAGSGLSEARLAEEAALLADKSDIQEELTRLAVHSRELRRLLDGGGAIGKQVDFLLQEMNRETNTALAKSAAAAEPGLRITNIGLAVKVNIERIREQALNLE